MDHEEYSQELERFYDRAFLWPDVRRRVFVKDETRDGLQFGVYRAGGDQQYRCHYRRSYEVAVAALYEAACQSPRRDPFTLPLMFLWRHVIETTLKDLIRDARRLFFEDVSLEEAKALGRHDLNDLWRLATPHLRLLGCREEELSHVVDILREVHDVDPAADGFRYPFGRDGRSRNLERLPSTLDLHAMNNSLQGALNFLSSGFYELQRRDEFFSDYEITMACEYGWPDASELGRARRAYSEENAGTLKSED